MEKKSLLKRIGVSGYNKPKRTPSHPTKSHVVVAKEGEGHSDCGQIVKNVEKRNT